MDVKIKSAKGLKAGNVILMKNTDLSYLQATVKSAVPYVQSESSVVRDEDGVTDETVITYEFTMYGKTYGNRKLIVPDTDVVLVVK